MFKAQRNLSHEYILFLATLLFHNFYSLQILTPWIYNWSLRPRGWEGSPPISRRVRNKQKLLFRGLPSLASPWSRGETRIEEHPLEMHVRNRGSGWVDMSALYPREREMACMKQGSRVREGSTLKLCKCADVLSGGLRFQLQHFICKV